MRNVPLLASFVCGLAAILVGYRMVPGESEKLAMLLRDGHGEMALSRANDLYGQGDREPALLMQASVLNRLAGDYEAAAEMLDAYFKQRPDDAAAWRKAAELYEVAGRPEMLRQALENVVRLTRDAGAVGRLAAIHRFNADEEDELLVLALAEPKELTEPDAVRLARLLAARNRAAEAVEVLKPFDGSRRRLSDEGRIGLFTALLDARDFDQAADRALAWQEDEEPAGLDGVFVGYLLRAGADDQALRLATSRDAMADAGATARLAQLLFDEGRYDLVERIMTQSFGYAQELPPESLDAYVAGIVDIARGKGIGNSLFAQLLEVASQHGSAPVEASLVQAMFDQLGYPGIAPFRQAITPRVLSARPVFAARLFAVERNALAARRFLLATDLVAASDPARMQWMDLARQMLTPQELGSELAWRARAGAIPPEMKRLVLEALLEAGTKPHLVAVWQSFFDTGRPELGTVRVAAMTPLPEELPQ